MTKEEKPTGLALLRMPFPAHQISKLPKPTKAQTDAVKADFKKGIRCKICGGWHHPDVVHLDYVGHAALTDRLLECDPEWKWAPVAWAANGTPLFDEDGGLWIYLTVCGVTRIGYGHPDGKRGGDAKKEAIGDALRNSAMRFGAALDLWHKGDLHAAGDHEEDGVAKELEGLAVRQSPPLKPRVDKALASINAAKTLDELEKFERMMLPLIKDADGTPFKEDLVECLKSKRDALESFVNQVNEVMESNNAPA
jgi:hypothetical protein